MNEKLRLIILVLLLAIGIGYIVWLGAQSSNVLDQTGSIMIRPVQEKYLN